MDTLEEHRELLFRVQTSIRYHYRRRAFYDRADRISNFLSIVLGSTTVYGVLEERFNCLALASAALVTISSAINLVWGSALKARDHADFIRKYTELEKKLTCTPEDSIDESFILSVRAERLTIQAEEPPTLHALAALCYNEQVRAIDGPKSAYIRITTGQRLAAHFFDYHEHSLTLPKAEGDSKDN